MVSTTSSTRDQALELLGQGVSAEIVASALGVSASQISQYLADPEFAAAVTKQRYLSLQKNNQIDDKYTNLEAKLLEKFENSLIFLTNPDKILRAIQVINAAKRRGISAPQEIHKTEDIVPLVMPTVVQNIFTRNDITVNINNQVVKAGDQDLVTIQSGSMNKLLKESPAKLSAPTANNTIVDVIPVKKEHENVRQTNSS